MNLVMRSALLLVTVAAAFIGITSVAIASSAVVPSASFALLVTGILFVAFAALGVVALAFERARA